MNSEKLIAFLSGGLKFQETEALHLILFRDIIFTRDQNLQRLLLWK